MTAFLLTPDFAAKAVQCKGSLAVGELAPLEVRNVAGNLAGLRVRIRCEGRDVAMFPLTETDAWSAEGESAKAFIELNTVQLRKCFKHLDDNAVVQCNVIVESNDGDRILICKGMVNIKNWPAANGQIPVSLATWTDDVAELREDIAKAGENLAKHESSADAHKPLFDQKAGKADFDQHVAAKNAHGVTPEAIGAAKAADLNGHKTDTRAHEGLLNAKLNTATFDAHTAGQQLTHAQSDTKLTGLKQDFDRHDHGTGGGKKINHASLDNIGTKTHNQLEEDVTAANTASAQAVTTAGNALASADSATVAAGQANVAATQAATSAANANAAAHAAAEALLHAGEGRMAYRGTLAFGADTLATRDIIVGVDRNDRCWVEETQTVYHRIAQYTPEGPILVWATDPLQSVVEYKVGETWDIARFFGVFMGETHEGSTGHIVCIQETPPRFGLMVERAGGGAGGEAATPTEIMNPKRTEIYRIEDGVVSKVVRESGWLLELTGSGAEFFIPAGAAYPNLPQPPWEFDEEGRINLMGYAVGMVNKREALVWVAVKVTSAGAVRIEVSALSDAFTATLGVNYLIPDPLTIEIPTTVTVFEGDGFRLSWEVGSERITEYLLLSDVDMAELKAWLADHDADITALGRRFDGLNWVRADGDFAYAGAAVNVRLNPLVYVYRRTVTSAQAAVSLDLSDVKVLDGSRRWMWEVWLTFTNTAAALAVTWDNRVQWVGPALTSPAQGEYRVAMWTADGKTVYARQVQPDTSVTRDEVDAIGSGLTLLEAVVAQFLKKPLASLGFHPVLFQASVTSAIGLTGASTNGFVNFPIALSAKTNAVVASMVLTARGKIRGVKFTMQMGAGSALAQITSLHSIFSHEATTCSVLSAHDTLALDGGATVSPTFTALKALSTAIGFSVSEAPSYALQHFTVTFTGIPDKLAEDALATFVLVDARTFAPTFSVTNALLRVELF